MTRRLLAVVFALCAGPATAAELPPAGQRLERALAGLGGIRADFVQIRSVDLTGEELQASGTLVFRPPDAFRLVYTEGGSEEITVTGDSLWVVNRLDNQAMRFPFDPAAPGNEVFVLFGGADRRVGEVFEVTEEEWAGHPDALRLEPRAGGEGYPIQDLRLLVGADGLPVRFLYREITGDTVVFQFTDVVRNPPDLDDRVRLDLPEGIDVLDGADLGVRR